MSSDCAGDPDRCAAAGFPEDLEFATKPALALGILSRTVVAGFRPDAVVGDEVYGNDSDLRVGLECLGIGYVLGLLIHRNRATGELTFCRCWALHPVTVAALPAIYGCWK